MDGEKGQELEAAVVTRYRVTKPATVALRGFVGELRVGKVLDQAQYEPRDWEVLTGRYAKPLGLEPVVEG
jgi:hypothetical protein